MGEKNEFRHRSWAEKFSRAWRGLAWGIQGRGPWLDPGFAVHLTAALIVVVLAMWLRLNPLEWSLLLVCVALVMTAELLNGAVEMLSRAVSSQYNPYIEKSLDIAAGAVLLASILSAGVAAILFLPKLFAF